MKPVTKDERQGATRLMQSEVDRRRDALRHLGFHPAFFDYATCTLHPSRDANGRLADVHLLDGLPDEVVVVRTDCGRVIAVKTSLMVGFERHGYFYTPTSAWRAAREWGCVSC